MPAEALVGIQIGDEGKGKVADVRAASVDAVGRYQGGNNTGKTVQNEYGRHVSHIVPTGVFHKKISIVERGVVIHPPSLVAEIDALIKMGINFDKLLKISPFAHIVGPWHQLKDRTSEAGSDGTKIGTTGQGIGPCYQDKMGRKFAIRVADLLDKNLFLEKLRTVYEAKSEKLRRYGDMPSFEEVRDSYGAARERIVPFIADTGKIIRDLLARRKTILLEGAQAFILDVDHGTFPFVTSSNTGSTAALMYTGIPFDELRTVVGVLKAYPTRVGRGPFPTEIFGIEAEKLRELGSEYGSTTGRPRRCGWLDLQLLRYAAEGVHATELALTKLDVLGRMGMIKICIGYEGVSEIGAFEFLNLEKQVPIYETINVEPIDAVESRDDFPGWVERVIKLIEEYTGVPVTFISTGPERNQYIQN